MEESDFEMLLREMQSLAGLTDAVTLFTSMTHGPIHIEGLKLRMEIAAMRMARLRQLGYQAGINVLATIGHHEEALTSTIGPEFGYATDINGGFLKTH